MIYSRRVLALQEKVASMTEEKKTSPLENVVQDLKRQVKERRVRFTVGQILILLVSILLCFIILSTQFGLTPFDIAVTSILIAVTAGLLFYLVRRLL